ncbi:transposase, partial [Bacillus toyonensis]
MNKLNKYSKVFIMFCALSVIFLIISPNKIIGRSAILKERVRDTYPNIASTDIELVGDTPSLSS